MKTDIWKIVVSILGGALAGAGIYAGYININWSQIFGG